MTDVTRSIWTLVLSNVAVRPFAGGRASQKRTFADFGIRPRADVDEGKIK